jgi:hypothetical protein
VDRRDEPSFEEQVNSAARALEQAGAVVGDLEIEIQRRSRAVVELQEQHEIRRALYLSIAASAFFFAAGVGVTLLTT